MTGLQIGDEIQCDKCGSWHRVSPALNLPSDAPEHVQRMLYYFCLGLHSRDTGFYFAGTIGSVPRLPMRRP